MYLIIIFIIVVIFYLNRKSEGFWRRGRIQAKLDEERRLRPIEEQKELDRISKEESKGILTSYSYINLL